MDNRGGRGTLEINGRRFSVRGSATIMPNLATPTSGANMDGSGYTTIAPKLASGAFSFDRGAGFQWTDAFLLGRMNVTWREDDVGTTHLFTGARFNGDPSLDTATGEVTGLTIVSDSYQAI
jgi:hypothetical protein